LTLIPTRLVAVGSIETARIAVPVRVRLKKTAEAAASTTSAATMTRPWLVTRRPARVNASPATAGGRATPTAPNTKPQAAMISSATPAVATTMVTLGWLNSGRMTSRSVSSAVTTATETPNTAATGYGTFGMNPKPVTAA
jgi:hypothetical protein